MTDARVAELPDEEARGRIRRDLASTLFVDAGAGSGKTSELVQRACSLVTSGQAELAHIAAITFTEKAAAELRDRLRCELEAYALEHPDTPEVTRCRRALDQLDGAAVGTLHSFARRILSEHPIEAGLPPRIEVLDEVSSSVAFEQRWSMFRDRLLADESLERTLLLFFSAGVRPEALRHLAKVFDDNWDLVEERVHDDEPDPRSVHAVFEPVRSAATALLAEGCADPDDKLRQRIEEIGRWIEEIAAIEDESELLEALGEDGEPMRPGFNVGNKGRKGNWDDVAQIRGQVSELGELVQRVRGEVAGACARRIAGEIRCFTLAAATDRREAGQLQFHDLLVLARSLLRDPRHGASIRVALQERYQRILLDEFQDTDPIQIDLAVRIAAADPQHEATGRVPWQEVTVAPGRLFVVGDAKQSIYRFRRADIAVFLDALGLFGVSDGKVELTSNFRTVEPIISWVNATFETLMNEPDDVEPPFSSQAPYLGLDPLRRAPESGPPVSVLGRHQHPNGTKADELRSAEAAGVASAVSRIVRERWTVDDGQRGWRQATLGDIAVLVPARTSLPFLEDALEAAEIPFRTESSSLVYASRPVRDLLMVLRAVDDPTNHLHIVSALRTPLLGCGDDDLFRFRCERRGHWNYAADQPDSVPSEDPVRLGLEYLRSLYEDREWLTPSQLLDRIVRERRALELGFAGGRPRDAWRRLRFLIDQARAWSGAIGGNLRQYLAWVALQAAEGTRVGEPILPETDDDAVRIMTIHAAKGLEFPITIVSGMSTAPRTGGAPAEVVFEPTGEVHYRFSGNVKTEGYDDWRPIDEQMGFHERVRLLYVACTRARDHLVVSLHRSARVKDPKSTKRTNAELLVQGMGAALLKELPDAADADIGRRRLVIEPPPAPPPFDEWLAERTAALERAAVARTVAATALSAEGAFDVEDEPDPGLQKRPRDLDLPPWLKGRYGSAVGRAVHGVLQAIDLGTGEGLEAAVAAQCEAEAVVDRAHEVEKLVLAALGAPSVREAARSPCWREVYVSTPLDGRLLEGYIDLLYRTPQGLVVADYKTSATSDPGGLDARLETYRNQGASYALAVALAAAEPVVRVMFLFLTPDGAFEREVIDLDGAINRVRNLVVSGAEVLAP